MPKQKELHSTLAHKIYKRVVSEIKASFLKGILGVAAIGAGMWFLLQIRSEMIKFIGPVLNIIPYVKATPDSLGALEIFVFLFLVLIAGTAMRYWRNLIRGFFICIEKFLAIFSFEINIKDKIMIVSPKNIERGMRGEIRGAAHGQSEAVFAINQSTKHYEHTKKQLKEAENPETFCKEHGCITRLVIFKPGSWPTIVAGKPMFVLPSEFVPYDQDEVTLPDIVNLYFKFGASTFEPYARMDQKPPIWMQENPLEILLKIIVRLQEENKQLQQSATQIEEVKTPQEEQ